MFGKCSLWELCETQQRQKADARAPDYDDWTTPNQDGFLGLNGDIMYGIAFSMSH